VRNKFVDKTRRDVDVFRRSSQHSFDKRRVRAVATCT